MPQRAVLGGTKVNATAGCVLGGTKANAMAGCTCLVRNRRGAHGTKPAPLCQAALTAGNTTGLAWVAVTPALGPESRPGPAAPASPTGEKASGGRHRHADATDTHTNTNTHTMDHSKTWREHGICAYRMRDILTGQYLERDEGAVTGRRPVLTGSVARDIPEPRIQGHRLGALRQVVYGGQLPQSRSLRRPTECPPTGRARSRFPTLSAPDCHTKRIYPGTKRI
jgi:hypothetical protein